MGRRPKSATPRSARGDLLWSNPSVRSLDDQSIGSALSLKDQFDILVPIRIPERSRTSDDSEVSSITTDEHRKMLKYLYSMRGQRAGLLNTIPTGLCCCTEMNTNGNNVYPSATVSKKKKKGAGHGMAPTHSVDKTCDVSRSQYSLFDALSDEEEEDEAYLRSTATDDQVMMDSPIKRKRSWRKSIRKKMPWSKK